jgi:hypothetical protein
MFAEAFPGTSFRCLAPPGDASGESELQSTANIVRVPRLLHEEISAQYSRWQDEFDGSLRTSLSGASFGERWDAGMNVIQKIGILKGE